MVRVHMPPIGSRLVSRGAAMRWVGFAAIAALCVAGAFACGDTREVPSEDGSTAASPDASQARADASAVPPPPMDGGKSQPPPWQMWDASGGFDLEGEYCYLRVGAECDGPEDCPRDGGRAGACCARVEPSSLLYTSIECADACDFKETFPLCHAGQTCTADASLTCRTSILIPDDFIGVCARPLPTRGPPTGEAVAGEIDCGGKTCVVGAEQCCLRKGFDADRVQSVEHEPYCAPIGEACDCEDRAPEPDAGDSMDGGDAADEDDAG